MYSIINKAQKLNIPIAEAEPVKISAALDRNRNESRYDMHFGLELGIVMSGMVRRQYPGHSRLVRSGQVWFCGVWEPHGFEVVKPPCETIALVIWPPLLAQLQFEEAPELNWMAPFILKPADRPQVAPSKQKIILELASQLKKTITPSSPVEKAQIRICLLNILTHVLDSCPELKLEKPHVAIENWSRLNHAVQLVFENQKFVATGRAAKECGLNRITFSRLFKQWMGTRFSEFALRFRIQQSAHRLLTCHEPIKAIVQQWGFADTSHFNRVFWKHYGCSPSVFRRSHVSQKT